MEGQRLQSQPLLADPARLGVQLEAFGQTDPVAGGRRTEQHLVGGQQARPLLRVPIQRHQRQGRLAVAWIGRQDPLVGLERALGLVELLLGQRGHPLEQPCAGGHVGRAVGQGRQLIAQIAEGPLLGVQRLERPVVSRLRVDLAQRAGGAGVLGVQRLDAAEDLDGGGGRPQPFVEQRAAPLEQRQLGGGVPLGVGPLAVQDLDQGRPAPLAFVERGQARQGVRVAGLDGQDLVVQRESPRACR